MTNTAPWREIVAPDEPTFVDGAIEHFGDAAAEAHRVEAEPTKAPLQHYSVVRVSGEDAIDFLHAQLSGDCLTLGDDETLLTSWCTPKGRVLYLVRLLRQRETNYLLLPRDQSADFCKRLSMFVLRANVDIDDLSADHGVILVNDPAGDGDRRQTWNVGRIETLADIWSQIDAAPIGAAATSLVDVHLGLPRLAKSMSDQFLPQELNLDALGGVSFEKGCFPGQEIIARVKFRGVVKRRVQRLGIECDAMPAPGARIVKPDDLALAGTVLYTARSGSGVIEMLVVLNIDLDDVVLESHPEIPLTFQPLPYPLAS